MHEIARFEIKGCLTIILPGNSPKPDIRADDFDRSMVTPTVTEQGAQILLPDWALIQAYLSQNF